MIKENFPLDARNTLGLKSRARYFASIDSVEALQEGLEFARARGLPVLVLGGGSNTVLPERIDGLVLGVDLKGIDASGSELEISAGEVWHDVVLQSLEAGLYGLENLSLIPGSAGAAPIQNIGAYGAELDRCFVRLDAVDRESLERITLDRSDCRFGYRDSIFKGELRDRVVIVSIRLSLARTFVPNLAYHDLRAEIEASVNGTPTARDVSDAVCRIRRRKLPDPADTGNAGSFFKNPEVSRAFHDSLREDWPDLPFWPWGDGVKLSAAWMIDRLGLKGSRVGDAAVSTRHALVLVNVGNATSADLRALAARVQEKVKRAFGVTLEIEPVIYEADLS